MGETYENAINTVVRLGEEDNDKEVLQDVIAKFCSESESTLQHDIDLIRLQLDLPGNDQVSPTPMSRGRWRHQVLVRLLNRQWFTQVWIFQEAVKSSKGSITWGSVIMSLKIPLRVSQAVFVIEEEAQRLRSLFDKIHDWI